MKSDFQELRLNVEWRLKRRARRVSAIADVPSDCNAVFFTVDDPIARNQVFPFYLYSSKLRQAYGIRFCELDWRCLQAEEKPAAVFPRVQWVCLQTWFDLSGQQIEFLLERINQIFPNARINYFDWFAPLDLRYAGRLQGWIHRYYKKQVLRDVEDYRRPHQGDTNLTDYYSRRFGLDMPVTMQEPVDDRFFSDKLLLGPSFYLAPYLISRFSRPMPVHTRKFDVHARIAIAGEPWYSRMRQEAKTALGALQHRRVIQDGRVSRSQFMREVEASTLCFSPFGYGEICWRDFEAIACGAVLVKPDVGHIRMDPDLLLAEETYAAVRWDLADFRDTVEQLLGDESRRSIMAARAFEAVYQYLSSQRFVDQVQWLFTADPLYEAVDKDAAPHRATPVRL
ncbi:glycosyltransferase [Aquabacterium sp. J223]|uniref:glycosyltransferase n=1 Tax=Aquabacterium sp. J223 TaxID=2898431 RepID=UPI0021ADD7FA|nr:glycosyltransferase [Aquabacterium sp. J223]UUX94240.1 glycosyltransferase [Aquabacterium sp. J223]